MSTQAKISYSLAAVLAVLAAVTTACDSGAASPTSANPQASVPPRAGSLMDSVDANIRNQGFVHEDRHYATPLKAALAPLVEACAQAGGSFDSESQECFCPNGAVFTTMSAKASCMGLSYGSYAITENSSSDSSSSTIELSLDPELLASNDSRIVLSDAMKDVARSQSSPQARPFRLSFYEGSDLFLQIDPSLMVFAQSSVFNNNRIYWNPYGDFDYVLSAVVGAPFARATDTESNASLALYEPDASFVPAALGIAASPLAPDDETRFEGLSGPNKAAPSLASAIAAAYRYVRELRRFDPSVASTPYASGCASYCVLSEIIPLNSLEQTYSANYEKVYQAGTPSARAIVIRENDSNRVLAVVSLNVAETVSTVNLVIDNRSGYMPFVEIKGYDRYGNFIYDETKSPLPGVPFPNPLQYLGRSS